MGPPRKAVQANHELRGHRATHVVWAFGLWEFKGGTTCRREGLVEKLHTPGVGDKHLRGEGRNEAMSGACFRRPCDDVGPPWWPDALRPGVTTLC